MSVLKHRLLTIKEVVRGRRSKNLGVFLPAFTSTADIYAWVVANIATV